MNVRNGNMDREELDDAEALLIDLSRRELVARLLLEIDRVDCKNLEIRRLREDIKGLLAKVESGGEDRIYAEYLGINKD
jgi:hypothetical protein